MNSDKLAISRDGASCSENSAPIGGLVRIGQQGLESSVPSREVDGVESSAHPREKKLYIHTFGCQMNVYDSEKLTLLLASEYALTAKPEEANLILVNTCSIREKAEHKLYSLVGGFKNLKEANPELLIGVGGCVAQQEGENVLKRAPLADFVFGTHNLSLVPSLVSAVKDGKGKQVAVSYREDWEDLPLYEGTGRASTFVTISRGCNKNCTYCVVPATRGPEVSRPTEEVIAEVSEAARRGVREVTLLGQTVNSYGLDLSPRMKFPELLRKVADVDGIERIRFTSPHPQEIREDFFAVLKEIPQVCKHVHMPLQSGSDRVLKLMNRNYRMKRYFSIIDGLRSACPDIALSTDLIVGFPGETEEDFELTLEAMSRVKFDSSFSFAFSPRPGTVAKDLPDQLEEEVKKERLYRLQELQTSHTDEKLEKWLGQETEILTDGFTKADTQLLQGRNSQNVLVHLEEHAPNLGPGMLVRCRITRRSRHTLHGIPVEFSPLPEGRNIDSLMA